jgi:hypothetical protein
VLFARGSFLGRKTATRGSDHFHAPEIAARRCGRVVSVRERSAPSTVTTSAGSTANHRVVYCGREPVLSWRVKAGNGRVLGEAVDRFATRTHAASSLRETTTHVDELTPSYAHPGSGVGWGWIAVGPDGAKIAQATRSYERRATCVTGYERFVSALRSIAVE